MPLNLRSFTVNSLIIYSTLIYVDIPKQQEHAFKLLCCIFQKDQDSLNSAQ